MLDAECWEFGDGSSEMGDGRLKILLRQGFGGLVGDGETRGRRTEGRGRNQKAERQDDFLSRRRGGAEGDGKPEEGRQSSRLLREIH